MKRLDLYNKSRMTGDCHVRFCERLRVKFPLPTRRQTVVRHAVILNSKMIYDDKIKTNRF